MEKNEQYVLVSSDDMTKNSDGSYSINLNVGPKINSISLSSFSIPKTW